jgi:hypothetical protein
MKFVTRKGRNITGLTQMGWVAVIVVVLVVAGGYNAGWFTGTPVQSAIDTVFDVETDITVGLNDVFFKTQVREDLGAFADANIIVNAYSDETGTWLATATASSGLATFSAASVKEGSYVWLQARQAAPSSADGYVTPLAKYRVGNGDPTDTVSAYNAETGQAVIWVRNLHDSTAPTFVFTDASGDDVKDGTTDNITTTDTFFRVMVAVLDDECGYGALDFTDMVSGDSYKGGIWIVWRGTKTLDFEQGSARELLSWGTPDYVYYAWNFYTQLWQDSLRSGDQNSITATIQLSGSDTFADTDTLQFDIFDLMKVSGSVSINSFVDGGSLSPTAITAYID